MFLDPKKGYLYHNIHDEYPRIADLQLNFIIDEPEIGRSEYWVNKVAERIISTNQFLEDNKSMMIVSHRETLLRTFSLDSRYHIMQPKESVLEEE
jgi:Fe-S cluster assembly ATPase SufC